ncbi:MAG: S8 family serine peptidase [Crocinitomicaceae bacterium]|nr:S8 family serine peptidase [Crocinitomicaceae bacterium]
MMKLFFPLLLVLAHFVADAQVVPGELLVQLDEKSDIVSVQRELTLSAGILPGFKAGRIVSAPMRIWLVNYDENAISPLEALRLVKQTRGVTLAQFNHIIEERETVPDDPFFTMQWHHLDPEDNDIDSDLAWDITTGGLTSTSDEIVVCVIETQGAKWEHSDLLPNHWVNSGEIPDNGIDDDGNGYTDDYDGWNIGTDNDNIDGGNHGTQVSSMIGAKGNNGSGIAGVNWNVKLMQVQMGNINELNVLEAYSYPLVMRKKYNESGGQQGAFIVAANSSWGINNGQPANSPLWCQMYDSLGYYGILSCAATTNSNVNIDEVGDLPTGCPSDYLISVTATNSSDVRTFSGYGTQSVDLAAPGGSVYLAGNTSYGNATGTSFSSPCVAGAVALLYSAPCSSIMQIAYTDPALAALTVRDYILNGVDAIANLQSEVATGGRLNLFNSLNLLMNDCDQSPCIAPFGIFLTYADNSIGYNVNWAVAQNMQGFSLRYRTTGNGPWATFENITAPPFYIHDLLACQPYELQLMATCSEGQSEWSESFLWPSEGCCVNPVSYGLIATDATQATITWNDVVAATGYELVVTPADGGPSLTFSGVPDPPYVITGLSPCTSYSVQAYSNCVSNGEVLPGTLLFNTTGCLTCAGIDYCEITGSADLEWIAKVELGTITNESGSDNGYGDYTSVSTHLEPEQTYTIACTPGYSGFSYSEYFKAWIDYNGNGLFENNTELIFDAGTTTTSTISGEFTVPAGLGNGSVRLRVGMSYLGSFSGAEPISCGEIEFGETEDYCIAFGPVGMAENDMEQEKIFIYPNPAASELKISADSKWCSACVLNIYDSIGRLMMSQSSNPQQVYDISTLDPGLYSLIMVSPEKGEVLFSKFIVAR